MNAPVEAVVQMWTVTLVIYAVVVLVVALLLTLVLRAARRIEGGVAAIWDVGQRVANNTIQIALLHRTNRLAAGILGAANGVAGATGAIRSHAESCPGCPACVLGRRHA